MRQETTNTFTDGLIMDTHPLVTPNNVLTNALNATLITYNGNEYVLLNDMGNGRVETAYLPEGYIPVGIKEFGGIIYVVSYNPLEKKSLIGSFPSPERNISTEELLNTLNININNDDFKLISNDNWDNNASTVFYVKKELTDTILNNGDKFLVYTEEGKISENKETLYGLDKSITNFLKLSFAVLTDEGKVVELENLKEFPITDISSNYIIPEMTMKPDSDNIPDIDSYRTLISSPYNIFRSSVSGKLLVLAELLTIKDFDVSVNVEFVEEKDEKQYILIEYEMNYESDYDNIGLSHIYYSENILGILSSSNNSNKEIKPWGSNNKKSIQTIKTSLTYDTSTMPKLILNWEVIPCMPFGPINYLKKSGTIDLSNVGDGSIILYEWRYFIDNNNIQLNWGLETYLGTNEKISKIQFEIVDVNTKNSVIKTVANRRSYNGSFTEIIEFNEILPNKLYIVKINIEISNNKENSIREDNKYRWLYTSNIFNKYYIERETLDFLELYPDLEVDVDINPKYSNRSDVLPRSETKLGNVFSDENNIQNTISVTENYIPLLVDYILNPSLKNDYKIFSLNNSNIELNTKISKGEISFGDYNIISSKDTSEYSNIYLKLEEGDSGYDGNFIPLPEPSELITDLKYNPSFYVETKEAILTELSQFKISFKLTIVEFIKAFCSLILKQLNIKGTITPLVYDDSTLLNYGLELSDSKTWFRSIYEYCGTWWAAKHSSGFGQASGYNPTKDDRIGDKINDGDNSTINFLDEKEQNRIKEGWPIPLSNSITIGIFSKSGSYGSMIRARKDENLAICSNWPWNRTKDRNIWYHNKELDDLIFAYPAGYWGDTGAIVFMNTIDDYIVPLNMVIAYSSKNTNGSSYIPEVRKHAFINYSGNNLKILNCYNLLSLIAIMLNLMYRYEESPRNIIKYIPDSIYYIDKYDTNYGINIDIIPNIKDNSSSTCLIDGMTFNTILRNVKDILGEVELPNTFYNNIEPKITLPNINKKYSYKTTNSGISLRNELIDKQLVDYGTMIIDNQLNTRFDVNTYNPNNVLYINSDGIISALDSNFKYKVPNKKQNESYPDITYTESDKTFKINYSDNYFEGDNLSGKFVLVDGNLRLNTTSSKIKSENIRIYRKSSKYDTYLTGFLMFGPIKELKCWKRYGSAE